MGASWPDIPKVNENTSFFTFADDIRIASLWMNYSNVASSGSSHSLIRSSDDNWQLSQAKK